MRRILNDIPIKRKLMMIIMGVSSVVLFLVYLVFVIHEYRSFRRNVSHDMGFLASAVAHSCATGIVHDDPKAVSDAIAVLSGKQGVVEARVFNGEGVELAGYSNLAGGPTELVDPKAGATRWTSHGFRLLQPVVLDGEMLGHLYIRYEFGQLKSLATHYLLLAALVGLASALVAWLLSVRLQRVITEPVFHLADVVHAVALEKNYSVRASAFGKDELG